VPVGEGLVTYRTLDEAATQANRLLEEPEAHRRAARALAEEFFDGRTIAAQVCELIGVAP
jgi:4'-phosphopantetheinyl transferase EntD